jgi:hypothetical protein
MFVGIRRTVSAYGTVTRLAPAGRHPPKPSHQTMSFMKKNQQLTELLVDVEVDNLPTVG